MMRSPAAHFVPVVACIFLTVPAMGESITISIFIADRTNSGCLGVTCKKKGGMNMNSLQTQYEQHSSHLISFLDLDFENLSRHGQSNRSSHSRQGLRSSFYLLQFPSFSPPFYSHSIHSPCSPSCPAHKSTASVRSSRRTLPSRLCRSSCPLPAVVWPTSCLARFQPAILPPSLLQIRRLTSICSAMSSPVKNTLVGSLSTGPYRCRKTSNSWNTSGNIAWDITSTSLRGRSYFNSRSFFILSKSAGGILSPARPSIFGLPRRT